MIFKAFNKIIINLTQVDFYETYKNLLLRRDKDLVDQKRIIYKQERILRSLLNFFTDKQHLSRLSYIYRNANADFVWIFKKCLK